MKVSVCMAAYHGERFIRAQIGSILPQLAADDELLVSDDDPGGETEEIVRSFADADARVHYLRGPGQGVVRNFGFVLSQAHGEFVFLCDQDDVWEPDKVSAVLQAFDRGADLVLHDARVVDETLQPIAPSFFALRHSRPGFLYNFLHNSYMGCCMAVRRDFLQKALPLPDGIPMHDQWLGLYAEKYGVVRFLPRTLLAYRQHSGNVTGGRTTAGQKIRFRLSLLRAWTRSPR